MNPCRCPKKQSGINVIKHVTTCPQINLKCPWKWREPFLSNYYYKDYLKDTNDPFDSISPIYHEKMFSHLIEKDEINKIDKEIKRLKELKEQDDILYQDSIVSNHTTFAQYNNNNNNTKEINTNIIQDENKTEENRMNMTCSPIDIIRRKSYTNLNNINNFFMSDSYDGFEFYERIN